jgi:thiamine pyrophosphate-dependent acetolactate synthase large subunit-like protein
MEAWHASIVVVALAQEVPMSHRGRDAFQEVDNRTLFASWTKRLGIARRGYRAEELFAAAVRSATRGRLDRAMLMLSAVVCAIGRAVSG